MECNRHKTKFDRLRQNSRIAEAPPTLDKSKIVINLSGRTLTPIEEEVLMLGMNYSIALSRIPVTDIIAARGHSATPRLVYS